MLLKEKVFIVTGASSGIGEELSKQLSIAGSKVVCAARRMDQLERVCQSINDSGGVSIPVQTDITAKVQCENLIKNTSCPNEQVVALLSVIASNFATTTKKSED